LHSVEMVDEPYIVAHVFFLLPGLIAVRNMQYQAIGMGLLRPSLPVFYS
jgi:hypothetical protein